MTEQQKPEKGGMDRMLVLGFDAGCGTCAEIAGRVEERVGDALAVRNLGDPEVMGWREEILGKNAPWAPTLFEVDGSEVRAWTGKKMALPLSRKLGLSKTWQLMQALGEMPGTGNSNPEAVEGIGMSRGKFLKGVGGAAVAMSVLSGAGPLASFVQAAEKSPYDIVQIVPLSRTPASQVAQRARLSADTKIVLRGDISSLTNKYRAYRYTLRNGIIVNAVMFYLPGGAKVTSSILSRAIGNRAASVSKLWKPLSQGAERLVVVRGSEGGRVWRKFGSRTTRQLAGSAVPLGDCPPVSSGSNGSLCTITTNECIDRGASLTGDCALPTYGAAATCVGGGAAAGLVTLGSGGILGGVVIGAAAAGCEVLSKVVD